MTAHDKAKKRVFLTRIWIRTVTSAKQQLGANVDNVGGKLCRHALLGYAAKKQQQASLARRRLKSAQQAVGISLRRKERLPVWNWQATATVPWQQLETTWVTSEKLYWVTQHQNTRREIKTVKINWTKKIQFI